ncbi:hypothetical protein AAFF_G00350510 [Aldrovandia affinis]|uniref:C-type lectin domain-containing protein n=1 Tax=Aldrovandia affinis TaxID=143900 RepID=A0AAD7R625_9TELE|nr:hypothetical protein AAFF_G00350510 [Aldrovandia affinis]
MNNVERFVNNLPNMSASFSRLGDGEVQDESVIAADSVDLDSITEDDASKVAPFNQGVSVRDHRMSDSTSMQFKQRRGISWGNMEIKDNGVIKDTMEMHSQLSESLTVLKSERDQLQMNYSTLIVERDQLQKRLEPPCPEDWKEFQSRLYFPSRDTKTWSESQQYCTARGAELVTIKTREEQVFVNGIMAGSHFWIGLSDRNAEGTWKWVDGETLTSGFWKRGEPNNSGSDEDCATSEPENDPLKNWNDMPCNINRKWVCERPVCH